MKSIASVFTALLVIGFSQALLAQTTRTFEVTVSFDPDHPGTVPVTLTCDGGIPLEQSFEVSETAGVTFTVQEVESSYTCVVEQAPVEGYVTSYSTNGEAPADSCPFSGAYLLVDNTCEITNVPEVPGFSSTTFVVNMQFTDDNPMGVEVGVACSEGTTVTSVESKASSASPAEFEVTWPNTVSPVCTAKQAEIPAGYNGSEPGCRDVAMTVDPSPECTLWNYQRSVPVHVGKRFLDGNPMAVPIELNCDSGTVVVHDDMASNGDAAVFRVREFPYTGATCSAQETVPEGYELVDTTCSNLAVELDARLGCETVNKPLTPAVPDPVAITGSWYSPDSSGEGFMIHSVSEDLAVGYFYGYDGAGGRLWLIGVSEGPFEWGEPALFEAQYATGGSFTGFDPGDVTRVEWGIFTVTLWDCDRATIEMLGRDGEKLTHLVRLAATSGTPCAGAGTPVSTDAVTGSWFENATSGQGFSVHKIDADSGVVYFYGFDEDGGNLWLTGTWTSEWAFGDVLVLEMLQASGGTFGQVDPELVLREPWGTLELRFDDCTSGWARLEGVDGMQELDLDLLAGSLGLECGAGVE